MKKLYTCIVCLILILQWSCQKEEGANPLAEDSASNPVRFEINVHQTSIDQYETPDEKLHADFMGVQLKSLLAQNARSIRRHSFSEGNDTVFTYDEIPLIRETRSRILVFADGTSETQLEDLTPDGINPLYTLTETPPASGQFLSRTHIKDGRLKVYNKQNELLIDEVYPEQNLNEFLDSLQYYVQLGDKAQKVMSLPVTNAVGLRRMQQPDGTVMLEQQLGTMSAPVNALPVSSSLKAITIMNDELTRTLRFELHGNQQLIHRTVFVYEDSYLLNNYVNGKEYSSNPRTVESLTLQLSPDGDPVFYRSKTLYHRYQTVLRMNEPVN
ncbi:MAG: hypothetical protein F9K10_00040 [Paludibacter sp.]|nr:MAG: hypothetical protein F9K10_00040 [Paludibacter sp.]